MEHIISQLGKHLYSSKNHKVYLIDYNKIAPLCKKWSRNRDPDNLRVSEMYKYYINNGFIPNTIFLAELDEGLVCYDGNHRREMYNLVVKNIGYTKEIPCIVDVMFNSNLDNIYMAFENINKSVQVPVLYFDETNSFTIKNDILNLVRKYVIKYNRYLSASNRYLSPNFNIDAFSDNLYEIYTYFDGTKNMKEIEEALDILNEEYKNERLCRPHECYNTYAINKCKKYGLYLFLDRKIIPQYIQEIFTNKDKKYYFTI